jgi:hypothetical protein
MCDNLSMSNLSNFNPNPDYKCPKCGGLDFYFGSRLTTTGQNALGMTRQENIQVPCCRNDDEVMINTKAHLPMSMGGNKPDGGGFFGMLVAIAIGAGIAWVIIQFL